MKISLLALAFVFGYALLPATAQDEKSPGMRLLEVMDFQEMALSAANSMFAPFLQNMKAQGLPPEAIEEISAVASGFFAKVYANPDLATEMAQVYADNFSESEIEDLIMFYDTPVGAKSLVVMPQVMQQSMVIGQKYAAQNQAEFQKELQDIMAKYQQPADAPEEAPAPAE